MRVLIYGFGAVGLYYGFKFLEAGHGFTYLDPRMEAEEKPVIFEDGLTGTERKRLMRVLTEVPNDEAFSLLIVTLSSHHIDDHIDRIAQIASISSVRRVMLMGGYVSGMERWAELAGREKTVFAYPGVSAVLEREEGRVRYCDGEEAGGTDAGGEREARQLRGITAGPLEGELPEGSGEMCRLFTDAGIPVTRSDSMRAVFLSQAAVRLPMSAALIFAGGNLEVLSERGDLLKLMVKGIREGLAAVRTIGFELNPPSLSMYRYVPIFIIANIIRGRFDTVSSRIGIEETVLHAGLEPRSLSRRFMQLVERAGTKDEHLRFLFSVFEEEEEGPGEPEEQG